jgi:hypothetical protein
VLDTQILDVDVGRIILLLVLWVSVAYCPRQEENAATARLMLSP